MIGGRVSHSQKMAGLPSSKQQQNRVFQPLEQGSVGGIQPNWETTCDY